MAFKLMMSAQKKLRKLDGQNRLPAVIRAPNPIHPAGYARMLWR